MSIIQNKTDDGRMAEIEKRIGLLGYGPRRGNCDCPDCGKFQGSEHYEQSPECWVAWQARLEEKAKTSKYFWSNWKRSSCRICKRSIISNWPKHCCPFCAKEQRAAKQKARREAARITTWLCEFCDQEFTPARADAKFCSPACRQAAHRLRLAKPDQKASFQESLHTVVTASETSTKVHVSGNVTGAST